MKMEYKEEREKVLVPVRRREAIPKKECREEPPEPDEMKARETPRRWYVY
jgi:hypothetical protein